VATFAVMKIVSFPFAEMVITPIGFMLIKATKDHIHEVSFIEQADVFNHTVNPSALTEQCKNQLLEYFNGTRTQFDLPLFLDGTDFQKNTWELIQQISYGDTMSYLQLAQLSGDEKNTRAVANANGKNKLAILIPCHRIIGNDGKLTGYAWGLKRKQFLIDFEQKNAGKKLTLF
jgi:methylated-DNA-[protein]-cysteine S-methyltransferase